MRILIACEYSGIVRSAFERLDLGHTVISCDIIPTEDPNGNHHIGDVRKILDFGFDLMIAHPPCTYLTYAGIRHWNSPGRKELREEALQFFLDLHFCSIPLVAIENPVGYPNTVFRKPDQIVKPYYFGEPEQKNICLWLKGLPLLEYPLENKHKKPEPCGMLKSGKNKGKKLYFVDRPGIKKGTDGGKSRSKFFVSVAEAMANQWGKQ